MKKILFLFFVIILFSSFKKGSSQNLATIEISIRTTIASYGKIDMCHYDYLNHLNFFNAASCNGENNNLAGCLFIASVVVNFSDQIFI